MAAKKKPKPPKMPMKGMDKMMDKDMSKMMKIGGKKRG
jgi:hypothetical protein